MSKEALEQALEALEMYCEHGAILRPLEARDAIKEALAKQEQSVSVGEPVAEFKSPSQRWEDGDDHDLRSEALYKFIADTDFKHCGDSFCFKSGGDGDNGETLMFILDCWFASTPQQRTLVGLTDEQMNSLWFDTNKQHGSVIWRFARAIEAAHGIKE